MADMKPEFALFADSRAVQSLYQQLSAAGTEPERLDICARLILAIFDDFYAALSEYPNRAQRAFENNEPRDSLRISHQRLRLYSDCVLAHGPRIKSAFAQLATEGHLWNQLDSLYRTLIAARYEADIAFSFAHSLRRNIYHGVWKPVAYAFSRPVRNRYMSMAAAHQRFELDDQVDETLITTLLQIPRFKAPYRDLHGDAQRVASRWKSLQQQGELGSGSPLALDILEAGFFRDLTAFLVGRLEWDDGRFSPFALALLNSEQGIYIDALLYKTSDLHNLFSSTLANFHVSNPLYYQICVFLYSLMPRRPLGLHYSTIGFNHVGKVAILNDIEQQLENSASQFSTSPGHDGTVAIGFTFESCSYHLKVIRDKPTRSYKWGEFAGVEAVLDKYKTVHEINRTGSMLDNVMYFNLKLDRQFFDQALLQDLAVNASQSVQVENDFVLFKALIVQLKIIPLSVYFETATRSQAEKVVENLGHCIKNNIAANIFNKDLDARNYGVGRFDKVFLFDYDAVEKLTEITLATNLDMEDGEEDIPDWFFSDRFVFLPEELESGLQISERHARRHFREYHADLLSLEYWQRAQQRLLNGEVLGLRVFPGERKLHSAEPEQSG